MNITYLIGNGFDLNMGLKTRYSDFLRHYLRRRSKSIAIATGKERIRQQMQDGINTWADMEIALGKLTTIYGDNVDEFLEVYHDIILRMADYLKLVEKHAKFDDHREEIKSAFSKSLINPSQWLTGPQPESLMTALGEINAYPYRVDFISFNYTTVFDECLSCFKKAIPHPSHEYRGRLISDNYGNVTHIHGSIYKDLVLGVGESAQIINERFHTEEFYQHFVKLEINASLEVDNYEKAEHLIAHSHIIAIFGMSLGESDIHWWVKLYQWLMEDEKRQLIIFVRRPDYNPVIPGSYEAVAKQIKDRFFSHCRKVVSGACRKRVYIVINAKCFPFDLL